jgi:hygromycin-B 7''-O-kinase
LRGLVVKLFDYCGAWRQCFETELDMHRLLIARPHIPAPTLIATGELFADGDPWPYLVTTRLHGDAWRDLRLPPAVGIQIATRLGEVVRHLHEIPVPDVPAFAMAPDWMRDNRDACVARHLRWATLPNHLVEQIPGFLLDSPTEHTEHTEHTLIHADLSEDHLFIADNDLVGIIDWVDAFATDRHYELCALRLGAFGADKTLLAGFLAGYDWPVDDTFATRAMTAALLHQFDVFAGVTELARHSTTLEDLAVALWDVRKSP